MAYKSASQMPIYWPDDMVLIDKLAESILHQSGVACLCLKYAYSEVRHMFLKLTQVSCGKSQ